MYPGAFGLNGDAFGLSPDPGFLYLSPTHAEALGALRVGVGDRRGLIVMTGEVGTGKTLLLHTLLQEAEGKFQTAYVSNTKLSFDDVLRQALDDFGAPCHEPGRLALLDAFNAFLRRSASTGSTVVLVIDEAQNLSDDALENIRLLSNYETYGGKLLQIILAGQPELGARLRAPHLRQLNERVAVRCHLDPLRPLEVRRYVEHRLSRLGGSLDLFTPSALRLIIRESRGIPRRVNLLCYAGFMSAYANHTQQVDAIAVRVAIRQRRGITKTSLGFWGNDRWSWLWSERMVAYGAFAAVVGLAAWAGVSVALRSATPGLAVPASAVGHVSRLAPPPSADAASPSHRGNASSDTPRNVSGVSRTEMAHNSQVSDAAVAANEPAEKTQPRRESRSDYDLVRIPAGTTLGELARSTYGSAAPEVLARIQHANPELVDLDRIYAGDVLRFPR